MQISSAWPVYCVQSEGQSCCALYELEEVEAGLMHSGLTSRLTLSLLSAITNCACPGPTGGRVVYTGGRRYPLYSLSTSSIRALKDIAALAPFLAPLIGYSTYVKGVG